LHRHSSVSGIRCYASEVNAEQDEESTNTQQTDEHEISRRDFRFIFPEFLPDPKPEWRNTIAEKLSRRDMLNRRDKIEIPEFYVGSSLAVTVSERIVLTLIKFQDLLVNVLTEEVLDLGLGSLLEMLLKARV